MINEHDLKDHECSLYDLRMGDRFKLSEEEEIKVPVDAHDFKMSDIYRFNNLDGMYSYCTDMEGTVHHFAGWTKVRKIT